MSWAPNRREWCSDDENCREWCSDDENCREWPSSRNHLVVWNPIQQSRHLDDEGPSNDPIELTTTTDQHGITTG